MSTAATLLHPAERRLRAHKTGDPSARHRSEQRFLPTLFDRLMDDEPSHTAAEVRAQVRELIRRDIGFILNTVNQDGHIDRARHPHAARSCVNYGLPPLAGNWIAVRRTADVMRLIRQALLDFEPRLAPDTLLVTPIRGAAAAANHNVLLFEISGHVQLMAQPLSFRARSTVDLETSRVTLLP